MKQIKYLVAIATITLSFSACKKGLDTEAQFAADTTAIRAFVIANNISVEKNEEYGVFYEIKAEGTGDHKYTTNSFVTVDYAGKVLGQSEDFDNSNGEFREFTLGGLVAGWQIGIPYIQKGGEIRLFIPSKYGYGNNPKPGIPANSVLDFNIKLSDVK